MAILAACSTSGAYTENRELVEKLNQQGVNAMILSPFAVVPAFGIRLALEFKKHALAGAEKKSDVTFIELFQRASSDAVKDFAKKTGYQDMALEFQIVGRASLRLCKEEKKGE